MFVETYKNETGESMMAGGDGRPIPYPRICQEDWRAWTLFLPVRSAEIERTGAPPTQYSLFRAHGIPYELTEEIRKATELFDRVEVWRKRNVEKDPIAVGVLNGDRYLIARWGMERLLPFETIKKSVPLILTWNYLTGPAGVIGALLGITALGIGMLT